MSQVQIISAQLGDAVTNGPDKYDLFACLGADSQTAVAFFFAPLSKREEVLVNSIERDNGSGQSFNVWVTRLSTYGPSRYQIWYNTRERTGTVLSVE